MAVCAICQKQSHVGFAVSHSNRHTKTRWHPNLQRARVVIGGRPRHVNVCTRCLRTRLKKALV